ncbi:MAG TPA: hypothetical protein VGI58_05250 [Streptosporangiaceae bacterium]|jgi:hypothetical protein
MNLEAGIPRSRGAISGLLLALLGLWGAIAPFVAPYVHYGFTPDQTWHLNSGRLYYSVIPGGVALLGGLAALLTRNRGVGVVGGLLGVLGGAWFILGQQFMLAVLKKTVAVGTPIHPAGVFGPTSLHVYLDSVALFTGVGVLVLLFGALAMGRFSMVGAKDVAPAEDEPYYSEFQSAPSTTGGIPRVQ